MKQQRVKNILASLLWVGLMLQPVALLALAPNIEITGLFRDKAAVKINNKPVMLKIGVPTEQGIVLLRSNSKRAVISIKGVEKTFSIGTHVSTKFTRRDKTVVRIPEKNGQYLTPGLINGRQVDFLVDTGANVISMGRESADLLQIPFREKGTPVSVSTASEVSKAWQINLDTVAVGGITLNQVVGVVIDTDHSQHVLLGMSFLSRIKFTQDKGMVTLEAKTL